ncbi:MAG: C4-type zinc ribbon domain-containing protein [Spirochaetaceae bacterium]|jgi:predicted  nucleic acid-binding Zn-ribbon protein|nr:C4-type zinc ribbon domain-containing protein [Spirochaetaceae bacterium]
MQSTFEKLQQLQDILSRKYELEHEIHEIPRALAKKQELLNRLKKSYIESNDKFETTKSILLNLKRELAEAERLREDSEKKMDIISTQREYEALEKEIKSATEKEQFFRREIQKEERNLEEMSIQLKKDEEMIAAEEDELKEEDDKIHAESSEKQVQLNELVNEEKAINPGMDEDILFKFERIIKNKSGLGIVPIINGVCTGCHMMLPGQFVNEVRNGDGILFCPYCSRILFFGTQDTLVEDDDSFSDADVGGLADLIDEDFD